MTTGSLADDFAVATLIARLTVAMDDRDWDRWLGSFAPSATIDFTATGMGTYSALQLREMLSAGDAHRIGGQHLLGTTLVSASGVDTVSAHTEYLMTTLVRQGQSGATVRRQVGGWWDDELERTDHGWLISRRVAHARWSSVERLDPA
jgi:hypothetical protein